MIDWIRVEDLRSEIGAEGFGEVVALFLEETDEVIGRLSGPHDAAAIGKSLHFLKGSALNLGFGELAALCQDGERLAGQGAAELVDLGQVVAAYQLSKQAFLAGLTRLSAA